MPQHCCRDLSIGTYVLIGFFVLGVELYGWPLTAFVFGALVVLVLAVSLAVALVVHLGRRRNNEQDHVRHV